MVLEILRLLLLPLSLRFLFLLLLLFQTAPPAAPGVPRAEQKKLSLVCLIAPPWLFTQGHRGRPSVTNLAGDLAGARRSSALGARKGSSGPANQRQGKTTAFLGVSQPRPGVGLIDSPSATSRHVLNLHNYAFALCMNHS